MSETAIVLYKFDAAENDQVSLRAGETITVTNKNIGGGWWKGVVENGQSGLFPEAFVKLKKLENAFQVI